MHARQYTNDSIDDNGTRSFLLKVLIQVCQVTKGHSWAVGNTALGSFSFLYKALTIVNQAESLDLPSLVSTVK